MSGFDLRSWPRRIALGLVGFVLTGRVFNRLTATDLRNYDPATALLSVTAFCLVALTAWYVVFVVPTGITLTLATALGLALAVKGFPVLVQRIVTLWIDRWA